MLNKAQIIGRLGKDPECRYSQSGTCFANVSIATKETWKDKNTGEQKEQTEWHKCCFYGRLAEIVGEYLQKGSLVYVEGKIQTRKWQDRDGSDRFTTEINCSSMKMLSGKINTEPKDGNVHHASTDKSRNPPDIDDDIPF